MDILKKTVVLFVFLLSLSPVIAQNNVLKAFEESYVLEREGEYSKAIKKLKSVYDENSYEIIVRLGWLNYQAGKFTESMAQYQKAMRLMPYSEEAKLGYILPTSAVGKWDLVITTYKKILANSPNNTKVNYKIGLVYYGRKNYETAFKHIKKVVDLYPFDYDGLILFAWCNLKLGKLREAKILFNKSLMLSPNDKSALEGLSLIK